MTTAQELNGKVVDEDYAKLVDKFYTEEGKKVYEFKDGSKAYIRTEYEDCPPYMTSSLSTLAKRPIRKWVAL